MTLTQDSSISNEQCLTQRHNTCAANDGDGVLDDYVWRLKSQRGSKAALQPPKKEGGENYAFAPSQLQSAGHIRVAMRIR